MKKNSIKSLNITEEYFKEIYFNKSYKEICNILDITEYGITTIAKDLGLSKKKKITLETLDLTEEKFKELFYRYSYSELSKKLNVGEHIILKLARELSLKKDKKNIVDKSRFIELFNSHTYKEMTDILGLKIGTIYRIKDELGIYKVKKIDIDNIDSEKLAKDMKNKTWCEISEEYELCGTSLIKIAKHLNLKKHIKYSMEEKIIEDLNLPENIKYVLRTKNIISKELDIYFPDYNFAIEYNGSLWHSRGTTFPNNFEKFENYHLLKKTKECEQNNIQLYHIFDYEYNDEIKRDIWISMIRSKLGLSDRIYARKCVIKEIDTKTSKEFLNENHMQGGDVPNNLAFGLYYSNELVSLMTFGKSRFNKKYGYELLRFCNKKNFTVIGGASRLLKYFTKNYSGSIISYANRRWSNGNLYEKIGFRKINESNPNYFYIKDGKIFSRNSFQKHKLKNKLENFNEDLSEVQNMMNNEYRQLFDCGNIVYGLI